jgi:hypothetical protein
VKAHLVSTLSLLSRTDRSVLTTIASAAPHILDPVPAQLHSGNVLAAATPPSTGDAACSATSVCCPGGPHGALLTSPRCSLVRRTARRASAGRAARDTDAAGCPEARRLGLAQLLSWTDSDRRGSGPRAGLTRIGGDRSRAIGSLREPSRTADNDAEP